MTHRTVGDVCHRAVVLKALYRRSFMESAFKDAAPTLRAELEDMNMLMLGALLTGGTAPGSCTQDEMDSLFGLPVGGWTHEMVVAASWLCEAAGVLLWSPRFIARLPSWDTAFEPAAVDDLIPIDEPVDRFVEASALRPSPVLAAERDIAELWLWRSRTDALARSGALSPDGRTYLSIVDSVVPQVLARGGISEMIDGDFRHVGKVSGWRRTNNSASCTPSPPSGSEPATGCAAGHRGTRSTWTRDSTPLT